MFVDLEDYQGRPVRVDAPAVIKIRRALLSDEPKNTVFVDYATNGVFVKGTFEQVTDIFSAHIRLAFVHAPTGADVALNANGINAVQAIPIVGRKPLYRGNSVAIVDQDHWNRRVEARNMIALRETVAEATAILEAARR